MFRYSLFFLFCFVNCNFSCMELRGEDDSQKISIDQSEFCGADCFDPCYSPTADEICLVDEADAAVESVKEGLELNFLDEMISSENKEVKIAEFEPDTTQPIAEAGSNLDSKLDHEGKSLGGMSGYCGTDCSDPCYTPDETCWNEDFEECFEVEGEIIEFDPLEDIIRRHAMKMKREARLIWKGSKGMHSKPLSNLMMVYECSHAMDVEKARKLLVFAVESLLADINKGEWLHPDLANGPLEAKDLTIEIRFDNFFGEYVDRKHIEKLVMRNEMVSYRGFDCSGPTACHTRKERYMDAYQFVKFGIEMEDQFTDIENKRNRGEGVDKALLFDGLFSR